MTVEERLREAIARFQETHDEVFRIDGLLRQTLEEAPAQWTTEAIRAHLDRVRAEQAQIIARAERVREQDYQNRLFREYRELITAFVVRHAEQVAYWEAALRKRTS